MLSNSEFKCARRKSSREQTFVFQHLKRADSLSKPPLLIKIARLFPSALFASFLDLKFGFVFLWRTFMAQINAVRSTVEVSQLGVTLMHEHIFVLSTEIMQNFPEG